MTREPTGRKTAMLRRCLGAAVAALVGVVGPFVIADTAMAATGQMQPAEADTSETDSDTDDETDGEEAPDETTPEDVDAEPAPEPGSVPAPVWAGAIALLVVAVGFAVRQTTKDPTVDVDG